MYKGTELDTNDREALSSKGGAILSECNQGFVGVDYYNDPRALEKDWAAIEADVNAWYEEAEALEND